MVIGICTIELCIPGANSLKSKRGVIKGMIQRIRNKYNVSVCELDQQDLWKLATLGVACISNDKDILHRTFSEVEKFISNNGNLEIIDLHIEII